ncbi:response regulator [Desulforhopalus vacuolatus]|uniref:HD domain-containing phosphohydrolase n=1 Tax=Desulforhopalus vacuolatus TaxID=40414 RepID=UPI0019654197|nr:HD domain-containing phosphohydrolase [Desulforhopalus vacuolatus]MBM9520237.1 response regulator [Desulforhopalus vacuolatus]
MQNNISIKKALRESEENYLNMIVNNADGIVIIDHKGIVKFMNPAAEVLFGISADDFVGELFGSPLVADNVTELNIVRKGQLPVDVEMRVVETNWGGESAWLASLRDISSRIQVQKTLHHAAQEWENCFDSISDMVFILDENFRILRANKAVADILGIERTKISGQRCYRLIHGTEKPPAYCPLKDVLKTSIPQTTEQPEPYLKGIFTHRFFPIKNDKGESLSAVTIIRDVSSQRKTESENSHLNEALANSFEGVTAAISELAEIRDAYTAGHARGVTQWAVNIARQMGMDKDAVHGIQVCAMLHDIGKIAIPSGILNKPGKLSDNEWRIIAEHPKLAYDVLCNIPFPWPVAEVVYQHHERLDGSGYPRGLKSDDIHKWARILSVADVTDAMISHRPYRPALRKSVLKEELLRGRGKIYEEQVIDIALTLLFKEDHRIMVVDDESAIVRFITEALDGLNFDVQGFSNPVEAFEVFKKHPFPLLITDLCMPEMSGLELLSKVQKIHPSTRSIVITGYGEKEQAIQALRLGASEFLDKPFQIDLIRSSVENLMKRYNEDK